MSDFAGNEELLRDFLVESAELLADIDNRLLELERSPADREGLNAVFRGYHTIKGGAGFLGIAELVKLCHLTENLFDRLRNGTLALTPALLDTIFAATGSVRGMFAALNRSCQPGPANTRVVEALEAAMGAVQPAAPAARDDGARAPDWAALYEAVRGEPAGTAHAAGPRAEERRDPAQRGPERLLLEGEFLGKRASDRQALRVKDSTIRIDTARLDQVLNLSGEIGLARNRLNCVRTGMLAGRVDAAQMRALDEAVSRPDVLAADPQNAVMKTRMQPVGRLFQKYPRLVRELARELGKEIDLVLAGETTELDRTLLDELADPLLHLVRNAADHGLEPPADRLAAGKSERGRLALSARQAGDRIVIEIADDGRGMRPERLRARAVEKGLIGAEAAAGMDDRESLQLIFLPGFSTKDSISNISGRGVGMDVVQTNIHKLGGRIEMSSRAGAGTTITILLPLTLAILPVLVVRLGEQPFALPLAMVREIVPIAREAVQSVAGRATMVVSDEVLPVRSVATLLGWPVTAAPAYGVLLQTGSSSLILAVDGFVGRDDVVIKPLEDVAPRGIAGATLSGDGSVVLVLDVDALLREGGPDARAQLFARAA